MIQLPRKTKKGKKQNTQAECIYSTDTSYVLLKIYVNTVKDNEV